jgi:hypothetical protein
MNATFYTAESPFERYLVVVTWLPSSSRKGRAEYFAVQDIVRDSGEEWYEHRIFNVKLDTGFDEFEISDDFIGELIMNEARSAVQRRVVQKWKTEERVGWVPLVELKKGKKEVLLSHRILGNGTKALEAIKADSISSDLKKLAERILSFKATVEAYSE